MGALTLVALGALIFQSDPSETHCLCVRDNFAAMDFPFAPERASSMAGQVDLLFYGLVALTLVVLAIVFVPMFYFLYTYRKGSDADRTPLDFQTWKAEVTWSAIPLMIVMGIFLWSSAIFLHMKTPPPDADVLEINVIGKQWMWNVQHPEGKRELNELHVPLGRTVRLTMTSQDVIHDFAVPAFRTKEDVVPGRYTSQWFKATKTGSLPLVLRPALRNGARADGRMGRR